MQREINMGACGAVQKNNKHESGVCLGTMQGLKENPGSRNIR